MPPDVENAECDGILSAVPIGRFTLFVNYYAILKFRVDIFLRRKPDFSRGKVGFATKCVFQLMVSQLRRFRDACARESYGEEELNSITQPTRRGRGLADQTALSAAKMSQETGHR
jgi:hypothetical protein